MKRYKFKLEGYNYQLKFYGELDELKEVLKDFTILSYEEIPMEDEDVRFIKEKGHCIRMNEQEEI